ncbi:MAG TPA: hypothetical protein VGC96_11555 [Candidatus Elarobacter sp.]
MEKTQKLLGIALAVLALDGCRGGSVQQAAQPGASGSPTPSSQASRHYGHGGFITGAAAGIMAGRRANVYGGGGGGYGKSGTYGSGNGSTATVDRTLGGNRGRGGFGSAGARGGFGG